MSGVPVIGTEDIPELLFGRIDFACPICGESGNHVCVQGFQILLDVDDVFAAAVARTYYQLKYAGILPTSLEELASSIDEELDDRAQSKVIPDKKLRRVVKRKKARPSEESGGDSDSLS